MYLEVVQETKKFLQAEVRVVLLSSPDRPRATERSVSFSRRGRVTLYAGRAWCMQTTMGDWPTAETTM